MPHIHRPSRVPRLLLTQPLFNSSVNINHAHLPRAFVDRTFVLFFLFFCGGGGGGEGGGWKAAIAPRWGRAVHTKTTRWSLKNCDKASPW